MASVYTTACANSLKKQGFRNMPLLIFLFCFFHSLNIKQAVHDQLSEIQEVHYQKITMAAA
jgi:hypothetical protein